MYIYIVYGFASLVGAILVARMLHAFALKRLVKEGRSHLLGATVRLRKYSLPPAIVAVVAFLVALYRWPEAAPMIIQWFLFAMLFYLAFLNIVYFVKIKRAGMKPLFILSALVTRLISLGGVALFLYFLYRVIVAL